MKKSSKKISILLIFTMLMVTFSTTSFAQDANNNLVGKGIYIQSDSLPSKVTDLAKSKFQFLLEGVRVNPKMYEIEANQIDNLYLGAGFNVFTVGDGNLQTIETYYFPVILDENTKFILTITSNGDGNYSATLGRDFAVELNNLNKNSKSDPYIILGTSTGQLYAKNSKKLNCLNEKYIKTTEKDNNEKLKFNSIKNNDSSKIIKNISDKFETLPRNHKEKVASNAINDSNLLSGLSYSTSSGNSLNVTCVSQAGRPLCWAATVACIANYRNKTSLSATDVCNAMGLPYAGVETPVAADALIHKYSICSTYTYSVPSFSTIMAFIDNGRPIYMSSESSQGWHATTLYGYITSSQGVGISLMDPLYECSKQGYSSGGTFTYAFGSTTMTWRKSITIDFTPYPGYYIQYGSTGYYVGQVQTRLNTLGFNCGIVDQDFGGMTRSAVIAFQISKGIGADGVVGPTTWLYLFNK